VIPDFLEKQLRIEIGRNPESNGRVSGENRIKGIDRGRGNINCKVRGRGMEGHKSGKHFWGTDDVSLSHRGRFLGNGALKIWNADIAKGTIRKVFS
jgi:hypothetical protein